MAKGHVLSRADDGRVDCIGIILQVWLHMRENVLISVVLRVRSERAQKVTDSGS